MQDDIDYLLELGFIRTKYPSLDDVKDHYYLYGCISCTHTEDHKYWGLGNSKFYNTKGILVGSLRETLYISINYCEERRYPKSKRIS